MNVDEKVRCSITASLDLARSEMTAKVCLHLKGEPLTEELTLQINPGLQVTRVQSQGVECGFSQTQSDRVSVTLPKGMSDSHLVLELDYAGYLPQCDATEEEGRAFITDDFFWLRDDQYWFPVPVGLQEEMFPIPPGRYVVQMQLPSGWEVAASSPLVRRWNEGLFECYQWDTQDEYPGISIVGGRLQKHVDGKCTFLWFAPRPDLAEIVLGALDFCEDILGPCPHSNLTVVMGPRFVPGGYADRGLVYVGENKLDTRTLAHELVHQWWGRGVWAKHHGDRWVTEGLAEYLALLYLESRNETRLEEMLQKYKESFLEAVATWGDKPIIQIDSEDYQRKGLASALLYKKGAWLHRMLHLLLEGHYWRALRTIYSKYYGESITTEQYIAELTDICEGHRDALETFARQWLYAPGLPGLQARIVERNESSVQEQVIP